MSKAAVECPCRSGKRYKACCAPLHEGAAQAETPEALMRSRFAAFARGLGDYLVATLAAGHPDLDVPAAELARALGRAKDTQRFLDLCILHTSSEGDAGEVLFYARIFERGADRSFAELSQFVHEGGAWRYASGALVPAERLPRDVRTLTRAEFLELVTRGAQAAR